MHQHSSSITAIALVGAMRSQKPVAARLRFVQHIVGDAPKFGIGCTIVSSKAGAEQQAR